MSIYRDRTPHQERIELFMQKARQQLPIAPCIPQERVRLLRARLILEEALETVRAMGIVVELKCSGVGANGAYPVFEDQLMFSGHPTRKPDLVELADGCADLSVVTIGTLSAFGIADQPVLEEVDRSNLDKFRGDGHTDRETGKWIKPSNWQPPDIARVLIQQGAKL